MTMTSSRSPCTVNTEANLDWIISITSHFATAEIRKADWWDAMLLDSLGHSRWIFAIGSTVNYGVWMISLSWLTQWQRYFLWANGAVTTFETRRSVWVAASDTILDNFRRSWNIAITGRNWLTLWTAWTSFRFFFQGWYFRYNIVTPAWVTATISFANTYSWGATTIESVPAATNIDRTLFLPEWYIQFINTTAPITTWNVFY
jgi:hypothetical protein